MEMARNPNAKSGERLYAVWSNMRSRCNNPNNTSYKNYGGRGIKVCDEWNGSYDAFREWAYANGYDELAPRRKSTLDRIDPDGDYEPTNCRFATPRVQSINKRDTKDKLLYVNYVYYVGENGVAYRHVTHHVDDAVFLRKKPPILPGFYEVVKLREEYWRGLGVNNREQMDAYRKSGKEYYH